MANEIMGVDVLIYADSVLIAGQRDCTINISGDSIDTTTKDNGNWKTSNVGLLAWSISLSAVEFAGQSGKEQAVFEKYLLNRTPITVRAVQKGKKVLTGTAIITSKETSGSYSDVSTGTYELAGNSALTVSFVPYIESAVFSSTTTTVTLSEAVTANGSPTLKDCVTIDGSTVSAVTIGTGDNANKITVTTSSAPTAGKKLTILGGTICNGEAVQTSDIYTSIVASA